jgi:hypothetical protein
MANSGYYYNVNSCQKFKELKENFIWCCARYKNPIIMVMQEIHSQLKLENVQLTFSSQDS